MKSVHFKSRSNENIPSINVKRLKAPIRHEKKTPKLFKDNFQGDINTIKRPGSYPISTSRTPNKNWHEILSGDATDGFLSIAHTNKKLPGHYDDDNKLGDELVNFVLPTVNFCCAQKENDEDQGPNIVDLCDDDKRKIGQLVEAIAKCKKEKHEDEEIILKLKDEIAELKTSLSTLMVGKNYTESKAVTSLKSRHSNEQAALKKQVTELNKLIHEMQVHKSASDARLKTVLAQAERLTRAVHAMHADNARLHVELRLAEDRLAAAHRTIDQLHEELKSKQCDGTIKYTTPQIMMSDKTCQPFNDVPEKNVIEEPAKKEQHKNSEDQLIFEELFFNPSLKNDFTPKETIIFLSTGCSDQLPPILKTADKSDKNM